MSGGGGVVVVVVGGGGVWVWVSRVYWGVMCPCITMSFQSGYQLEQKILFGFEEEEYLVSPSYNFFQQVSTFFITINTDYSQYYYF